MQFKLTDKQQQKVASWYKEQKTKMIEAQKGTEFEDMPGSKPYTGAIGGAITYMFTPTSIGTFITVRNSMTGDELALTDVDDF